jgi:hypothetical protein
MLYKKIEEHHQLAKKMENNQSSQTLFLTKLLLDNENQKFSPMMNPSSPSPFSNGNSSNIGQDNFQYQN